MRCDVLKEVRGVEQQAGQDGTEREEKKYQTEKKGGADRQRTKRMGCALLRG